MKPATPLPWKIKKQRDVSGATQWKDWHSFGKGYGLQDANNQAIHDFGAGPNNQFFKEDAAYIVHACNAYPKLIEALRAAAELRAEINRLNSMANYGQIPASHKREVQSISDQVSQAVLRGEALLSELGEIE